MIRKYMGALPGIIDETHLPEPVIDDILPDSPIGDGIPETPLDNQPQITPIPEEKPSMLPEGTASEYPSPGEPPAEDPPHINALEEAVSDNGPAASEPEEGKKSKRK